MRKILVSICLLVLSSCISLQAQTLRFSHFTRAGSGLCYDGVRTIFEDSRGNIWIGTYMGLSRYDGRSLTNYGKKELGVDSDFVSSLSEDQEGNIYVGTDAGICRYDIRSSTFHSFCPEILNTRIYSMVKDAGGVMWIGSRGKGLYRKSGNKLVLSPGTENLEKVIRIATDGKGRVFLASYCDDIYMYDGESLHPLCDGFFKDDNVEGLVFDRFTDGEALYVASKRNGLCRVNILTGSVEILYKIPEGHRPIEIVSDGYTIWISTTGGLVRYDTNSGESVVYNSRVDDPFSLSTDYVTAVCMDRSGGLWVGTASAGVNYSNPAQDRFHAWWQLSSGVSLEGCSVKGFAEDDDRNLWVATGKMGLLRLVAGNQLEKADYPELPDNITAVCSDHSYLWVGTLQGLYRVNQKEGKVSYYQHFGEEGQQIENRVVSLYRSSKGVLYVGTPVGVLYYDRVRDLFAPVPALVDITVESFMEDGQGNLWLASYSQGAFRYSPSRETVEKNYGTNVGIPPVHEMTSSVTLDSRGGVWVIGFSSGFYRFDKASDEFERICRDNNPDLPTDLYLSALSDPNGRLWISSDSGLVLYDPSTGGATTFSDKDGILPCEFIKSGIRLSDGTILFGQTDGFISLNPADFDSPAQPVAVRHTVSPRQAAIVAIGIILLAIVIAVLLYRRAMADARRKEEDRNKAKDAQLYNDRLSFFANVIHEIKTPLTLIRTPLQNLISSGDASADQLADLQIINNSTEYLDQLVKELLEFVRVEEHGYVLDLKNVDIAERLSFICYNFSETAKNANIRLTFKSEPQHIVTAVDTKALSKIFNNLIHNGIKYSDTYLDIHAFIEGNMVKVHFENDGPGIPADKRESVFMPFVRYPGQKREYQQSFGIGLAQARTLTELHGGTLVLSDRTDATEFILALPLKEAAEVPQEEVMEAPSSASNLPLILLVEDNADLSSYLRRKLRQDYKVIAVPSAEKALEVMHQETVDVLLTDIGLQNMSGVELCRRVSRDKDISYIPIIVISAISSTDTKIKCMENGATMYIEKPFSQDYLEACIKGVLEKRRVQKEAWRGVPGVPHVELQNRDEDFIRRLNRLISDNIGDSTFSNKQIEEALFISRSSLNRRVKELLGTTPNDYVQKKRLAAAAEMLRSGSVRVNEVAFAVGFNSPSYFAKCFKKEFGVLPAEYMNQDKQQQE